MLMRCWYAAILLGASGCQQYVARPAKTVDVTFDGAQVSDAAGLRAHLPHDAESHVVPESWFDATVEAPRWYIHLS
jgi:hypothetical protein